MKKILILGMLFLFLSCAFLGVDKEKAIDFAKEVAKEMKYLGADEIQADLIQITLSLIEVEEHEERKRLRDLRKSLLLQLSLITKQAIENVLLREKEDT